MASPSLDISLAETYNVYYLAIKDISSYPNAYNITNPSIEITPPGYNKKGLTFTPQAVNVFKSSQLGITCEDEDELPLPDGVYKVKYSINPNTTQYVEKHFMRVNAIRCEYGEAFLKSDFAINCECSKNRKDKNVLLSIQLLIEGSIAAANDCDVEGANKYYAKAKQLLDNFQKCNCK